MRAWVHYAIQDERALPGIREEGGRAGGARPLRGRVGEAIAFAARGSCWLAHQMRPGSMGSSGPAGAVSGGVVGSAPGGL